MGFLDFMRPVTHDTSLPHPLGITGLWWQRQPENPLAQLVLDDVFGTDFPDIIDRNYAMRVPAIRRARALIVGSIADLPLVAYRGDDRLAEQPTWAYRSDKTDIWHRMAATLDDILFYDESMWLRRNGSDGFPTDMEHIPWDAWSLNAEGQIEVAFSPDVQPTVVPSADLLYIPGTGDGGLLSASDTIRGARAIDRAWIARTRSPIPPTLFRQVEQETATPEEITSLITGWASARSNPETAAVAFVPWGLEPVFPTASDDSAMFIQGRNAVRLDTANLTNIPASLLDGSTATASLTYTTAEGQKSSFHEQSLRYWSAPIEHRLSMDDVVPRGQRVRFDITYNTQVAPTGEPGED